MPECMPATGSSAPPEGAREQATAPPAGLGTEDSPLLLKLSVSLVPELKRYMEHHRRRVSGMRTPEGLPSGSALAQAYASMLDGLFCSLLQATRAAMQQDKTWHSVAIGAVGTYGRQTLTPHSDIDVHIVCQRMAKAGPVAKALLYPLWNIGLSVSHQIIIPRETIQLAKGDLPTATALLD